ncbi:TetR/AcrR family transcriptional regulator [Nocardioides pelophilus]|uniref:TetR/AcrR family transcriptional regulator n=1 Tax=Nocardioides pelophilus TaxID=2172019 RepID=UPI0015FFBB02|nr:TetR/AcrR family transcriptional regulator [Nocardioides pelophilus]
MPSDVAPSRRPGCVMGNLAQWAHSCESGVVIEGLRERKRAATARALAEAAFDLAKERGLDGFVIEEVAEMAGYSRRTFANHYPCKEAAVASVAYAGIEAAADALEEVSEGRGLLDAVEVVLRLQLTTTGLSRMREVLTLARANPSLEPHVYHVQHRMRLEVEERMVAVAAGRYPPSYVTLLVGAVYGMVSSALEGLVDVRLPGELPSRGAVEFDDFLTEVFKHLRNGF